MRDYDQDLILPLLHQESGRRGISYLQGACLSINYVIGTGVFTLPLAFVRSGTVYGTLLLLLSAFCSYVSLTYITEAISHCEALSRYRKIGDSSVPDYRLSSKSWHFSNLSSFVLSNISTRLIQLLLCLFCYGSLWSFSSVFASSLSSLFLDLVFNEQCDIYKNPSEVCYNGYHLSLLMYGLIVVTLSLLDLKEQVYIQVGLTIYRFIAFALMLSTVLYSMFLAPPQWMDGDSGPPYLSPVAKWNWSGYTILTSSAVALAMHVNFPDVIQALEFREPGPMRTMTLSVYALVTALYLVLGLTCALLFGDKSEPLITLNWRSYTGPSFGTGIPSRYAIVLRTIIVAFPIFDMLSVFPLGALTLAANLRESYLSELEDRISTQRLTIISRFLAAIPPIMLAAIASNLESIFAVVGLIAFFLEFFVPCCLVRYARRQCLALFNDESCSPFSTKFSGSLFTWTIMLFAFLCTGLSTLAMFVK